MFFHCAVSLLSDRMLLTWSNCWRKLVVNKDARLFDFLRLKLSGNSLSFIFSSTSLYFASASEKEFSRSSRFSYFGYCLMCQGKVAEAFSERSLESLSWTAGLDILTRKHQPFHLLNRIYLYFRSAFVISSSPELSSETVIHSLPFITIQSLRNWQSEHIFKILLIFENRFLKWLYLTECVSRRHTYRKPWQQNVL